jgi:hypothetical protein
LGMTVLARTDLPDLTDAGFDANVRLEIKLIP